MGERTRQACAKCRAVYLHAVGGAGSVVASSIQRVVAVYFAKEFGSAEALWELDVNGLEALVTIDAEGRSLHEEVRKSSERALAQLLGSSRRGVES